MTEHSHRVAVVTGSESGIGRAVAVALAEQGHDVGVTWHRDEDAGRETVEQVRALGRRAELRPLDLTRLPEAADVVDERPTARPRAGWGCSPRWRRWSWPSTASR